MSARAWLVLALLTITACNPREFAREHGGITRMSIATGNTGGVFYPYGGGLAKVLSESLPRVEVTAEVTAASVDNLKLIQLGKVDIAFTTGDTLADAVRGTRCLRKDRCGEGADAGHPLPELHASGHGRGQRHRAAGGSSRQGRVDRLGGQRHRGHGVPHAARGRPRPRPRHPPAGALGQRLGGCHQGRQDRRILLERRGANGVGARSGEHRGPHGEAHCQRRSDSVAAVRLGSLALPPNRDAERVLSRPAGGHWRGWRRHCARRRRRDGRDSLPTM